MSRPPGRHPSDEDRERGAIDVLRAALTAARAGDREALRACYADDAVWLERGGRRQGGDAAAAAHLALGPDLDWEAPQQQGARAALRWTRRDAGAPHSCGAVVVEVRRGRIIFAAAAP